MKSPVKWFALLLLCGLTNAHTHAATPTESEPLRFEVIKKLIVVPAEVEGRKGYFILDTGASDLILNQKHFSNKKTTKVGGTISTILGEVALQTIKIEQFKWGKINRSKLVCPVSDLSDIEKWLDSPILGLIGYDMLQDYEVHIDYVNQEIMLVDKTDGKTAWDTPPTYALDFNLCGHLPVLEVRIGTEKVYLGLDSGATLNVLNRSWGKALEAVATHQKTVRFTGATTGTKQANHLIFNELILDQKLIVKDISLVLTDFEMPVGRCFRIDGLLGVDIFNCKKVVIDYRQSVLYLWQENDDKQITMY